MTSEEKALRLQMIRQAHGRLLERRERERGRERVNLVRMKHEKASRDRLPLRREITFAELCAPEPDWEDDDLSPDYDFRGTGE